MSATISSHNFTNLGRMFAKQNVPTVYDRKRLAQPDGLEQTAQAVDRVSLSANAPKPVSATLFQEAVDTGRMLGTGKSLPAEQQERLREDRVLNAMSALVLMGEGGESGVKLGWPGGLPAPTQDEMDAARRRLSQRLDLEEAAGDPEEAQHNRMELLEKLRNHDKTAVAGNIVSTF